MGVGMVQQGALSQFPPVVGAGKAFGAMCSAGLWVLPQRVWW